MSETSKMERREFIKAASSVTAGLLLVSPQTAFGAKANERLKLGLIGCGSRGAWIGELFQENTNTKVVALHDYFRDRVQQAAERLDVKANRCHVGLDGYKALLDSDLDAVAVESPPYFHPEQAVAALQAGKHVYLAKPIAVDVPGCHAIVEAADAVNGKQSMLVDFQTRNNAFYREAATRVLAGEIGEIVCGQSYYHCGRLGQKAKPGTEVARLRNWVFDIALSGDIIVEQNIHVLDVANWFLNGHPLSAVGAGGRRARTNVGDTWDHYVVRYEYPGERLIDFSSTQFTVGYDDLCVRLFGSLGTVETHYGEDVWIRSKSGKWPGGSTRTIYEEGAINNMKDFHAAILAGQHLNNARESANSTLTSILGRIAARSEGPVTWDEMLAANTKTDAQLNLPADGPETTA